MSTQIKFCISCIDRRFFSLAADYFTYIGSSDNFYEASTAGAGLSLGYSEYCSNICGCPGSNCNQATACDPANVDMAVLKDSLVRNINIALTLDNIEEIYILNHQDCGAIRAFLECSGYPNYAENNQVEIQINEDLLQFACQTINENFPNIRCRIGLQDLNGTVCDFNPQYQTWVLQYNGQGVNPNGLWYGFGAPPPYPTDV